MSEKSAEELTTAINAKGEEIRVMKTATPPATKEALEPLIAQLLALKVSFKSVTGEDFGGPKPDKKKSEAKKPEGPSKADLKKQQRIEEKAQKKAAELAAAPPAAPESEDPLSHLYGDSPIVQSGVITERLFQRIENLKETVPGQKIWIRARVATSRAVGRGVFILLRQQVHSAQGIIWQGEKVSKAMVKYAASIPLESIVDVEGEVVKQETPIDSATIKYLEVRISQIHIVSRAQDLPFQVEDASRNEAEALKEGLPTVQLDTVLNYRWVDTRTPANQAIFRIQSGVCQLFREFLYSRGFIEIHTPKLISGASEGGANVFKLEYFGSPACLAQSPQFYKQMTAACGGFERVFEIGPVFRAEDSNTHRHLCEFTGLDFEMAIYEHYYEALDVMGELFNFIFDGIFDRFGHELMLIGQQYPVDPIQYLRPPLRITFQEGITLLHQAGLTEASFDEDISTPMEKALGKIVKEKFNTDFYIMDKYPLAARPFYTMPDPENAKLSNSYDLFIRGEEIVSGAQRIHDVDLLIKRAESFNIPLKSIQSYVDAFKHGALPHAGGGIGLERVVMLFLGLKNIRRTSMFPRDPSRLAP
jgi:nondiscriminating aspartyl-tRNA synthetase